MMGMLDLIDLNDYLFIEVHRIVLVHVTMLLLISKFIK